MNKLIRQGIVFTIILMLFAFCSCSNNPSSASSDAEEALENSAWKRDEDGKWVFVDPITTNKTLDDAKRKILGWLDESGTEYRYTIREAFYTEGDRVPAVWIFAVNRFGDFLDVLIMPGDSDVMDSIWTGDHCLMNARKNETLSYRHAWHYPPEMGNDGLLTFWRSGETEDGAEYTVLYSGTDMALFDVHNYNFDKEPDSKGVPYWDGEGWSYSRVRPEAMNIPIDYEAYPGEYGIYRTYKPAESLKEELSAMQQRLEESGLGYHWEIRDSITVDDTDYPVIWLYAVNENEEWVDVVFTEDPDLCYLLQQNRQLFVDMRKNQVDRLNERFPGRILNESASAFAYRHEWLIQDCFFHGYYFFMDGNPMAMMDCGCLVQAYSWSEEHMAYKVFVSREGILGENVRRTHQYMPG